MKEKITLKIIHGIGSIGSLIIHTILFITSFVFILFGFNTTNVLLILTTIVSLEAIYLAIIIQMSVNLQSKKLSDIQEDVADIQEDVADIQEDVDDIQEDVDDIQKDVEEIQKDDEEDDDEDDDSDLQDIKETLEKLMKEVVDLKKQYKNNRNK